MLILGSSSPRRREILSHYNIPFSVATPPFDERAFVHSGKLDTYAKRLAEEKGLSLAGEFEQTQVILTADTLVVYQGQVFPKPQNLSEALEMLLTLNGKTHQVLTGVAVLVNHQVISAVEETLVTFCPLKKEQIKRFHKTVNPTDRAGGYAIQGTGGLLIERIEGNYDNVVGLPMKTTSKLLKQVGIDLWDYV